MIDLNFKKPEKLSTHANDLIFKQSRGDVSDRSYHLKV